MDSTPSSPRSNTYSRSSRDCFSKLIVLLLCASEGVRTRDLGTTLSLSETDRAGCRMITSYGRLGRGQQCDPRRTRAHFACLTSQL